MDAEMTASGHQGQSPEENQGHGEPFPVRLRGQISVGIPDEAGTLHTFYVRKQGFTGFSW